jgi:hypothetical protein
MKANIYVWTYLVQLFLWWEMFQTKVIKKIKTHILCSKHLFGKSCHLWDNVEKFCRGGQATYENMAHKHCVMDTKVYKHTLKMCNNSWCPTATMVARKRLGIMVNVHCLLYDCFSSEKLSLNEMKWNAVLLRCDSACWIRYVHATLQLSE